MYTRVGFLRMTGIFFFQGRSDGREAAGAAAAGGAARGDGWQGAGGAAAGGAALGDGWQGAGAAAVGGAARGDGWQAACGYGSVDGCRVRGGERGCQ